MVDLTSIRFLLDLKDIEAFYGSEDIEQEIQIINDNLFQNHSMTSQELNILKDFIFLLYKDCKKVHLSPNQTYSFINIVQQCFQYIMNLKYSEEIESNAISIFQSLMIKQHCIDKLFGIKDLQVVTKLYATAFVQNVYGYHFIFGVADEDEVIKLDSEILPGTTTMDPDKTKHE